MLLTTIDNCLKGANYINTCHEFLALMKSIDGMAFIYDKIEAQKENSFHIRCRDHISPTAEEVAIRARRAEEWVAKTYGIPTEIGKDLLLKKMHLMGVCQGRQDFLLCRVKIVQKYGSKNWPIKVVWVNLP